MKDKGKTPRSQAAKDRILGAAREVFAEVGYDRATVRGIAERASVVPAMLIRYFGGKAGVFAEAIQFDLALPEAGHTDQGLAGRALVAHFLIRWDRATNGGELVALLRASVDHPEARARMLSIFADQLVPAVSRSTGETNAHKIAALIASQMLGLAFCRYVLALPALQQIEDSELVEAVGQTVDGYLTLGAGD